MSGKQIGAEYFCGFCMTVTETEHGGIWPEACVCNMLFCRDCGAFLKGPSPTFCHGCGKVPPEARPRFFRTTSTTGAMHRQWWMKWTAHEGWGEQKTVKPLSIWIYKGGKQWIHDGNDTPVRELTKEEIAVLKGKVERL